MLLLQAEKEIRHFIEKLHVQIVNKPRHGLASYPNIWLIPDPPFFSFPITFKYIIYLL